MNASDLYARIRNIFNSGVLKSRNDKRVTVETEFARTVETEELFPMVFLQKRTAVKLLF